MVVYNCKSDQKWKAYYLRHKQILRIFNQRIKWDLSPQLDGNLNFDPLDIDLGLYFYLKHILNIFCMHTMITTNIFGPFYLIKKFCFAFHLHKNVRLRLRLLTRLPWNPQSIYFILPQNHSRQWSKCLPKRSLQIFFYFFSKYKWLDHVGNKKVQKRHYCVLLYFLEN